MINLPRKINSEKQNNDKDNIKQVMLPCFHYSFLKGVPKKPQRKKKIKEKKTGEQLSLYSNIQGNTHF